MADPTPRSGTPEPDVPDDAVLDELSRAFGRSGGRRTAEPTEERGERPTVSIGGDDDLPDAVYLDDELADDSGSGTVFIDDDGGDDAIAPRDATGKGMEPRLRQRRILARRSEALRRLRWVLIGVGVLLVVVAALAVLGSSLFAVDRVDVTGNRYTDPVELQAVIDDLEGTPVLLADTEAAEERLEAIPWVEDARVRTKFPDRATIEIRERTPVAAMPGGDGLTRVIDREGRVLAVIEGQPVALVWISGPGTLDLEPGEFASIGPSSAASLVTKLTPTVRRLVDSMQVTADGSDLRLFIDNGVGGLIEVRFGAAIGDNEQIEKLVRLERKLDDLESELVSVIDVSTAEVTVR